MKKPSEAAKKAKAKELFTLSHKLLDAAKQLSEHHATELRYNMQQAMDAAKTAAQKDMKQLNACLLYTSPSPRDRQKSRMPSSA